MTKQIENSITFRPMGIEDIDQVCQVENRSFTIPWSMSMFLDEMKNPLTTYFVAVKDRNIVAYAGLWTVCDEAHITNIAVDPSCRGQHIASGLMHKIFELARERKLKSLTLEVRASNTAAISLYTRFGFTIEGRRKAYYRDNQEDAFIMWCHLKDNS